MFYLYLNKCGLTQQFVEFYFPIQTANVEYFQKKNPIIRIICICEWLVVPINRDKWSSSVYRLFKVSVLFCLAYNANSFYCHLKKYCWSHPVDWIFV